MRNLFFLISIIVFSCQLEKKKTPDQLFELVQQREKKQKQADLYRKYGDQIDGAKNVVKEFYKDSKVLYYVPPEVKARWLYLLSNYKLYRKNNIFNGDTFSNAKSVDSIEFVGLKIIEGVSSKSEFEEALSKLAVRKINGEYIYFDRDRQPKEMVDKTLQYRIGYNMYFLRNRLFDDSKRWGDVRSHLQSIIEWNSAWDKEADGEIKSNWRDDI